MFKLDYLRFYKMSSVLNRSRQLLNKFAQGPGRRMMHIDDPVQMEKSIGWFSNFNYFILIILD